jgi:hypothetical protein
MYIKIQIMKTTDFTPLYPHYYEIFAESRDKESSRVIYFGNGIDLEEVIGKITGITKKDTNEEFLTFDNGKEVRADRIISINGKPGPAYDEYNNYGMACLDCN